MIPGVPLSLVWAKSSKLCAAASKEQFIERLLVMEQKRMQFVRKRKDYVVVRHRQKPSQLVLQPPAGMDGLAARAVPVAAAQRNAFALAAVGAFIDRVAERAGPANSHALEKVLLVRPFTASVWLGSSLSWFDHAQPSPLFPIASTGHPSIAWRQRSSSSGVVGCLKT